MRQYKHKITTIINESDKPLLRLYLRNEIFNNLPSDVLNDPCYKHGIIETSGFASFRLSVAFYKMFKPLGKLINKNITL